MLLSDSLKLISNRGMGFGAKNLNYLTWAKRMVSTDNNGVGLSREIMETINFMY